MHLFGAMCVLVDYKMLPQLVVCLSNKDYPASIEFGKVDCVIFDEDAEGHGYIKVIDESSEDNAYSSGRFSSVKLP